MVDRLPNQILPPDQQAKLDKEQIELMLRKHNLDENIDLVYELVKACANKSKQIDECIEQIVSEFDNKSDGEDNKKIIDRYIKKYES